MKKLDMLMYEDKQANRIKCDDFYSCDDSVKV